MPDPMKVPPIGLDALFSGAPFPVAVFGPGPTVVSANDAFLRAASASRAIVGMPLDDAIAGLPGGAGRPVGVAALRGSIERVFRDGEPDRMPPDASAPGPAVEGEDGPGGPSWEWSSYPVPGPDGGVAAVVLRGQDVSDRERLRRRDAARSSELAEARNVSRAIYDQGLFAGRLGLDGTVLDANRASLERCGFDRADVIGRPFWDCGWWSRSPGVRRWVREAVGRAARGETFVGVSPYFVADGSERLVEFACMPIADEAGATRSLLATGIDVTDRARAERDHRATTILESITDAFFSLDRAWRFTYLNANAGPLLLREPAELVGKVVWEEFPAAVGTEFEREYRRAMADRVPVTFEEYYPAPLDRWYEVNAYPTDEGLAVYFRNVTERRRAEEAVRRSEQRFRALATATSDVVYRMSPDWSELLQLEGRGFVADAPAPTRDWAGIYIHPDDRQAVLGAVAEAVRARGVFEMEHRVVRADGTTGWTFSRAVPILDDRGEVVEWFGTAGDVTARKEAEAARRRLEEESERQRRIYEAALSNTPDLVYVFDLDHRFRYANEALLALWGRSREEAIGKTCLELGYEPWHAAMHGREIDQVVATRRPIRGEVPFTGTNGRRIYDYIFVPVLGPGGEVVAVAGTTRDVTDRQEVAERLRASEERLRRSEERFRTFMDVSPAAAWLTDADGRIVYLSSTYRRTFGHGDDAIGKAPSEVYPEDLAAEYLATIRAAAAAGGPIRAIERGIRADGSEGTFLVYKFPIADADGRTLVGGIALDVTDQKRAEAELLDRELRYRLVADASNDVIWDWNLDTGEVAWNEGVRIRFGYPAEAVGADASWWLDRLHPDDRDRVARGLHEQIDRGPDLWQDEYRFRRADGSFAVVSDRGRVVRDDGGRAVRMVGSMIDLTERRRAEAALREAEERFEFVRRESGVGFWYCDLPFDVLQWDRRVKEHFFLPDDAEVTIGTFYDRIHPEDRGPTREAIGRSIAEHSPYDAQYRTVDPASGAERWVRAIGRTSYGPDGAPRRFDGITIDVSRQKEAERERERLVEELRRADRRKDEFLAMLAHELRNPLSAIGNAVQLARLGREPGHLEWSLEVVGRHVASLSRMIDDLLDVSRITRGKIELKARPLDVRSVLSRAVETVRPLVQERRHDLAVVHSPGPMWVEADPDRLEQVVVNLLANAAKYTPPGGRITLSARPDGDSVAVSVADDGAGIPPDRIPEMFELFAQGDRSIARSEGGLGIGLTLVKNLVELHGGAVSARSEGPGTGSEFTVRLPAATPPAAATATAAGRPDASARPPSRQPGGARILVVDDNEDAALALSRLLRVVGHQVEVAHDGGSALAAALRQRPDYVLLDIGLPGMDGYEVARRLRAEGVPDAVIIAVSGYGEEAARLRSREAGIDHYLVKPVDYDALTSLIRHAPGPPEGAWAADDRPPGPATAPHPHPDTAGGP